ncbi:TetR/AcrR family transcriptional regulator [Streptomyces sediminimaris]|uniref:TetR/AcrR family transcriptional regulator n=1 Tax=Streptomyces sediminimaris TaxID=3383721 RepID=UPI00399A9B0C
MADAGRSPKTEDTRTRMLDAAERLLSASSDNDVSTRAVCDAVGVGQPVLYRIFGDKNGLLNALVESGFERYISRKQALETTDDPVADLRDGWDDHMDFALSNRALYRLMFSPTLPQVPAAAGRIFGLLKQTLDRCAAHGALKIPTEEAAQAILSANVGVALSILSQPDRYSDPDLPHRVRDAVFSSCLVHTHAPGRAEEPVVSSALVSSALQLEARLRQPGNSPLGQEETALMLKWLRVLRQPGFAGPTDGSDPGGDGDRISPA